MILMRGMILSIAFLLLSSLCSWAQSSEGQNESLPKAPSFEYEDKCGDPLVESMLWQSFEGTVIKITGGDTVIVLAEGNKRRKVRLAAIDATRSENAARLLLTNLILNQRVEVLVNPSNIDARNLTGVVYSLKHEEVNRELIKAGAARYKEPLPYDMSRYQACVYRVIENETKEAKRGLWKEVVSP